jgi:short subunit dehydrogenase-like uncharacterized protein
MTASLLARKGYALAIAGRTESRVAELFAQPWCEDAFAFESSRTTVLREFAKSCRVMINCAGPAVSADLAWTAIEAGSDFVDSSSGLIASAALRRDSHRWARERAVALIPSAGLDRLLLDLYAAAVARRAHLADVDVHFHADETGLAISASDASGQLIKRTELSGVTRHMVTAHVIAETVRCVFDGDILASGVLDWRAFVPELFLESMPFEELHGSARLGIGIPMPEEILL